MFTLLLYNLRAQGIDVGLGEWLLFLDGLRRDLVVDLTDLYRFGRAVLVQSEAQYDSWDLAFQATFQGVELEPELSTRLAGWLREARELAEGLERAPVDMDPDELRREFWKRLMEQKERHDGGNRWIGTGGASPFGRQGRASTGIQVGGGGNRSALAVAGERRWADYRTDTGLDRRDFQVALRALRSLVREGALELDVDGTVDKTAHNAGDVDLVYQRQRKNRVHLVLVMDTGGSMAPHAQLVEQLFTAAKELKGFKSFQAWHFHNAPYGWLYKSFETRERTPIHELLQAWTPAHRLVFVGDASMAPYELFEAMGGGYWATRWDAASARQPMSGLDWLRAMRQHCPASVWLNPDPQRWWNHPTVQAIAATFPMFPLTLSGLRDAVRRLRVVQ